MQKIQFILGILAAASSSATLAYDGTINFTGKVVDQTCSVTTGPAPWQLHYQLPPQNH